ncbi:hypothetical protein K1719_040220 [Acacia pycnantha]|nr:hypothetical protein K1719_040220 [Acacia pycnantha]
MVRQKIRPSYLIISTKQFMPATETVRSFFNSIVEPGKRGMSASIMRNFTHCTRITNKSITSLLRDSHFLAYSNYMTIQLWLALAMGSTGNRQHERYQLFFGFGFDSKNKDYKVIRFVTLGDKENVPQVEVFSLASRSWRSIPIRVAPFLLSQYLRNIPQVFVNGVVHWVVSRRCDDHILNFILSFDVVEETFGEVTLPQHLRESTSVLSILQGGDSLCVLHTYCEEDQCFFSIWVMKEYGVVGSWNEVFRCDLNVYGGISTVLALCANGKVVLRLYSGDVVLLDPVTELVKPLTDRKCFHAFAGSYVKSLVFINGEPDVLSY